MIIILRRSIFIVAVILLIAGEGQAIQIDCTGDDRITSQKWKLEFTVSHSDSFCIRLPYPDYTMAGRWATYSTEDIEINIGCDYAGPWWYEETHYNSGYSNQGVWIEVFYPPGPMNFSYEITQSVQLNLPEINYGMAQHTNNAWMDGTEIVDVNASIIGDVLSEAQAMPGDWHEAGFWDEPEKVVNWLNQNMDWVDDNRYTPWHASYILQNGVRYGNCDEWAHAACALLLRAGVPARVVLVGATTQYNATGYLFSEASKHLCLSYWDGFGWIMIDPKESSGFAFVSRVILGADQDSRGIEMATYPENLIYSIYNSNATCEYGDQYGYLTNRSERCLSYPWEILEHFSLRDLDILEGTEPLNCIIPNSTVVSVDDGIPSNKNRFFVNYPNPFNPVTTFRFNVQREGRVRIDVYSVDGRCLETIVDRNMAPGEKKINWVADGFSSGIYFARFQSPSGESSRKLIILR